MLFEHHGRICSPTDLHKTPGYGAPLTILWRAYGQVALLHALHICMSRRMQGLQASVVRTCLVHEFNTVCEGTARNLSANS